MAEEEPTDLKVPENEVNTNEDMEIAPSSEWSKEDLEKLRLCRNRAYYKVNSKRRQHLQASLSTYLQKEWLNQYPDTGLSAKDLLKVYQDNFEPENKRVTTYFRSVSNPYLIKSIFKSYFNAFQGKRPRSRNPTWQFEKST